MIATKVTLNGKPAVIMGRLSSFATVASLDGTNRVEYSWDAVERIIKNGGKFEV
jgi:hypothetical protein